MTSYKIIILAILVFALSSCEKTFFEPEPAQAPEAIFENLWSTFYTDYGPFEERGVDWEEQYGIYRPLVTANTSDEELISVIKNMLRSLNDGHVSFTTPNSNVFYSNIFVDQRIDDELFDLEVIKTNYLDNNFEENGYGLNTYGWLGNIGYWHIDAIGENMLETNTILDYFKDADGLIIDLRHNGGGDFTYTFSEFGRFTNEDRLVYRSKTKNGVGPNDFTDWYDWHVNPSGEYFDKPIVILTDRYTISAGERSVMAFKTLPNVTHIGDTTNGSIATKIGKELANGWFYSVVTQKTVFADGQSFEGPGIPPDVIIKNTTANMANGIDSTLEAALGQF